MFSHNTAYIHFGRITRALKLQNIYVENKLTNSHGLVSSEMMIKFLSAIET